MDYINFFRELIENKRKIADDDIIGITLGEIADVWERKNVAHEEKPYWSISDPIKNIDSNFLNDIISVIKKLENKRKISFRFISRYGYYEKEKKRSLISDIAGLTSLQDKIFLEVKNNKESQLGGENKIKIITVVEPENKKNIFKIVINNDYLHSLTADRIKPSWNLLFKIAQKEQVPLEGNKGSLDYFNSNKNNKIYTQTGYKKTKILKIISNTIVPNIKIELISEKTFKIRRNKSLKET